MFLLVYVFAISLNTADIFATILLHVIGREKTFIITWLTVLFLPWTIYTATIMADDAAANENSDELVLVIDVIKPQAAYLLLSVTLILYVIYLVGGVFYDRIYNSYLGSCYRHYFLDVRNFQKYAF